ncbi:MAG: putative spermidine/putrescine transport system permease protein [Parasphingorhabdus sp.]|jgi:putative spermidine/putrescine transport system permease protein
MRARWELILIPPLIISFVLMAASQIIFLRSSFYADLGYGRSGTEFEFVNYIKFFGDSFYLKVLWDTVQVSFLAMVFTLAFAFPIAYLIARMRSRWGMILLAGIVVSTFVTIVIKVFGLYIMFSRDGMINQTLLSLGVISKPFTVIGNQAGVVIGLMHFTLGFGVVLLFSVVQTIPRSLEEAAQIFGASRWRVWYRVIVPLCLPGVVAGSLMLFNMCMGAFTSAALLGGGRVYTLPVLIQRVVIMEAKYGMGGTLSAVLLVSVLLINLLSLYLLFGLRKRRLVIA